jgi:hypothetical protein
MSSLFVKSETGCYWRTGFSKHPFGITSVSTPFNDFGPTPVKITVSLNHVNSTGFGLKTRRQELLQQDLSGTVPPEFTCL